jgi:hypothetical protein
MSTPVETIANALFQYEYGTHKDPIYERFPEYLERHREYCAKRARHIAKALEADSESAGGKIPGEIRDAVPYLDCGYVIPWYGPVRTHKDVDRIRKIERIRNSAAAAKDGRIEFAEGGVVE